MILLQTADRMKKGGRKRETQQSPVPGCGIIILVAKDAKRSTAPSGWLQYSTTSTSYIFFSFLFLKSKFVYN